MSDLQDAADRLANRIPLEPGDREVLVDAARKYANPDLDLAHRFDVLRIGGPTADGKVHLNGSLSNDEWGRLQAALGVTENADG